ncbi:hypothetical protein FACS1894218_7030 [Bacilli bacterium]|nr:hypothetical protein FACS1894218_7030 [Bacilli bacterium]
MIKNSRNISFNKARQLDFAAHLISTLTKELIENGTKYVKVLYTFAYRSIEIFAKPICSVRAYNDFYAKTGRDIRTFN